MGHLKTWHDIVKHGMISQSRIVLEQSIVSIAFVAAYVYGM